jgi:hypothetical protein
MINTATLEPATRALEFIDLISTDADLLGLEFGAIIAAEWPDGPPVFPRYGAAAEGSPGIARPLRAGGEEPNRSERSDGRSGDARCRQRSPPTTTRPADRMLSAPRPRRPVRR